MRTCKRGLAVKKLLVLGAVLAVSLLTSALPAFSRGSGPYGAFGPNLSSDMNTSNKIDHDLSSRGTGPYGSLGPVLATEGVVNTKNIAIIRGSGPYGSLGPITNKKECVLVSLNCAIEK